MSEKKTELKVIVRCKYCKHYDYENWKDKNEGGYGYCGDLNMLTDKAWWCADGVEA